MTDIILILTLLLKVSTLYFACVAVFALGRRRRFAHAAPATRFAVLAAARNEERVIGALVESIKAQNYPAELVDIYVIPNNCTDHTEAAGWAARATPCGRPSASCCPRATTPSRSLTRTTPPTRTSFSV